MSFPIIPIETTVTDPFADTPAMPEGAEDLLNPEGAQGCCGGACCR